MANRYWVGGTANWDGTAGSKWSLTSGGVGGQAVPTSADDVFFSSLSTGTCTISAGNTGAKSITCTGFTGTLAGSAAISVSGSVLLVAGMTYTYTGTMSILATGTITSAGKSFGSVTVNGSGITVTLGDALTLGITNTFTLTQGTVNLNAFTLSAGIFSSTNTNTRAITFGSANIALTSTTAGTTILSMATATGFTYTGTGGFTRNMAATATVEFGSTAGGSTTNAPNINFNAGASALTITANSWFNNLIFDNTSTSTVTATAVNITGNLTLDSSGTYTALVPTFRNTGTFNANNEAVGNITIDAAGGTITLAGPGDTGVSGTTTLTAGTLALGTSTLSTGRFISNNTNTRALTASSGKIALTSTTAAATILDMADATNFTHSSGASNGFTRVQGATATIAFGSTAGGSSSNAPNFTVSSGASALTITAGSHFERFTLTGSTCTVSGAATFYNDVVLASGGTYTSFAPTFGVGSSHTFNSLGKTLGDVTINGSAVTITLGDAMTLGVANTFTLAQGTINLNAFTLSTGIFSSTNTNTRAITFGSANIALTSTTSSTTFLNMADATNFTFTGTGGFTRVQGGTATMVFGTTGGSTTNAPNMSVTAGASTLSITTNSWFKNLNFTGSTCGVNSVNINIAGNLTLASGGNYTGTIATYRNTGIQTSNGATLFALTVNGSGGVVTCADALTLQANLTLTDGTLKLKDGATSTVGSLVTSGVILKYLESTTPGSQATISDTTGTNTVTYLSVKDSNATGGAVFDATSATNVNAGNNTGWLGFGGGGSFLLFFM